MCKKATSFIEMACFKSPDWIIYIILKESLDCFFSCSCTNHVPNTIPPITYKGQ